MDPAPKRAEDHDPPIAELVAEPLDDDPPVGRQRTCGRAFLIEVGDQVFGRQLVEVMSLAKACQGRPTAAIATREVGLQLADRLAKRSTELDRSTLGVALPERQLARDARGRAHDHSIVADLLDPPRARAEDDDVAVHPGLELVDHFLVELTDSTPGGAGLADHEHPEETSIRDRPTRGDRHDPGIAAAGHLARHSIPGQPWLQLGELVRWICPGKHPHDALQRLPRQRLERCRASDDLGQVVDTPAVHHAHRDDLLGEDVEGVPGHRGRLDRAVMHPGGDDRAFEEIAAVLGEEHAAARNADLVTGPADPLQAARDRRRRFDLHDEVDSAHVDAELQARGGDDRRQPSGLEILLDLEPLLARDRAVMGPDQVLPGELVESLRQPLG